jgi:hypothetical protein
LALVLQSSWKSYFPYFLSKDTVKVVSYWVQLKGFDESGLVRSEDIKKFVNGASIEQGSSKAIASCEKWCRERKLDHNGHYTIPELHALDRFSTMPCPNLHPGYDERRDHHVAFHVLTGCKSVLHQHCLRDGPAEYRCLPQVYDGELPLKKCIEKEERQEESKRWFDPAGARQRLAALES